MPEIIQATSPVIAVITERLPYVNARKQVDGLVKQYRLKGVADMPMAIQAMDNHPEVRGKIRHGWVDTITGEYHGLRDKDTRSYETWHSAGSLATAKGLEKAFARAENYGFMQTANDEWVPIGNGIYDGQDVRRVHLDDVKKGDVPSAGTPYTIYVRLDKDSPNINPSGQLEYDVFMQDDRVLMVTGSPENREVLAKMLFGRKEEGGEGWNSVGSYHRINEVGFDVNPKGRPVLLGSVIGGLYGGISLGGYGCFVGVEAAEPQAGGEKLEGNLVKPKLEDVLAVTAQFTAKIDQPALREALGRLYLK